MHGRPKGKGHQQSTVPQSNIIQLVTQPPAVPSLSEAVTLKSFSNISWDADPSHSEKLVIWLISHPADHHILCHDHAGNSSTAPTLSSSDKPFGRNKKDVQAVIAEYIFEHDDIYAELYVLHPKNFTSSVGNQLAM